MYIQHSWTNQQVAAREHRQKTCDSWQTSSPLEQTGKRQTQTREYWRLWKAEGRATAGRWWTVQQEQMRNATRTTDADAGDVLF